MACQPLTAEVSSACSHLPKRQRRTRPAPEAPSATTLPERLDRWNARRARPSAGEDHRQGPERRLSAARPGDRSDTRRLVGARPRERRRRGWPRRPHRSVPRRSGASDAPLPPTPRAERPTRRADLPGGTPRRSQTRVALVAPLTRKGTTTTHSARSPSGARDLDHEPQLAARPAMGRRHTTPPTLSGRSANMPDRSRWRLTGAVSPEAGDQQVDRRVRSLGLRGKQALAKPIDQRTVPSVGRRGSLRAPASHNGKGGFLRSSAGRNALRCALRAWRSLDA